MQTQEETKTTSKNDFFLCVRVVNAWNSLPDNVRDIGGDSENFQEQTGPIQIQTRGKSGICLNHTPTILM